MGKEGKLLVISGLSAAGKGTIASRLTNTFDDYVLSISATTREKRGSEVDGVDYFFITKEKFDEMVANGEFLESAKYVDNCYGTPKKYVEDKLKEGINVILEIEMQGALAVKKIYDKAILVFFLPKDAKTQRERLVSRGRDSKEQIEKRVKQAIIDADYAKYYDYVLINENIDDAINDIKKIVTGTYDKSKNDIALKALSNIVRDIKEEKNV